MWREDKVRGLAGGGQGILPPQRRADLGQGLDRQAVPFGEDLVVAAGVDALSRAAKSLGRAAGRMRSISSLPTPNRRTTLVDGARHVEDVLALEVAAVGHVVVAHDDGRGLARRPARCSISSGVQTKNLPSSPFAVGVLGAVEAARRMRSSRGAT